MGFLTPKTKKGEQGSPQPAVEQDSDDDDVVHGSDGADESDASDEHVEAGYKPLEEAEAQSAAEALSAAEPPPPAVEPPTRAPAPAAAPAPARQELLARKEVTLVGWWLLHLFVIIRCIHFRNIVTASEHASWSPATCTFSGEAKWISMKTGKFGPSSTGVKAPVEVVARGDGKRWNAEANRWGDGSRDLDEASTVEWWRTVTGDPEPVVYKTAPVIGEYVDSVVTPMGSSVDCWYNDVLPSLVKLSGDPLPKTGLDGGSSTNWFVLISLFVAYLVWLLFKSALMKETLEAFGYNENCMPLRKRK